MTPKYSPLKTPKDIEIQNFDPPKNDLSLCMYDNNRVPPWAIYNI